MDPIKFNMIRILGNHPHIGASDEFDSSISDMIKWVQESERIEILDPAEIEPIARAHNEISPLEVAHVHGGIEPAAELRVSFYAGENRWWTETAARERLNSDRDLYDRKDEIVNRLYDNLANWAIDKKEG